MTQLETLATQANLFALSYLLIVCLFMSPQVAQQVLENKERENEVQSLVHELRNKEVGCQTVPVPTFQRSTELFFIDLLLSGANRTIAR